MMNELQIIINPYMEINYSLLNGSPLSEYSELSNFLKQPLLCWADKLGSIAEYQINDYYSLSVVGEDFDNCFISSLMKQNELCKKCEAKHFLFNSPVDKRYTVLRSLAQKYGCITLPKQFALSVYSTCVIDAQDDLIKKSEMSNAFIWVVAEDAVDISRISDNDPHIIVKINDTSSVECLGHNNYLWNLPQSDLNRIISMIVDRFAKIPYIIQVSKELYSNGSLNENDKQVLDLALSIDPLLKIDRMDRIEVGKSARINVSTIPGGYPMPNLTVVSKDSSVLKAEGLLLSALSAGTTVIEIYKSGEINPIFKQTVDTYQDKTVKRIVLDRSEPNMCIGRSQKIDISFEPVDAIDSQFVIWSVDNPSVLQIDQIGNVTAIAPGRAVVTASTKNAQEQVIIDVLHNVEQINLSLNNVKMMKGESKPIQLQYFPAKVFDSGFSWSSSNNTVAHIETYSDGTSAIVATEVGECNVTCVANEGGCSASCNVRVLDPVEEEKKKKRIIDIACIIGVPLIILILYLIIQSFFK